MKFTSIKSLSLPLAAATLLVGCMPPAQQGGKAGQQSVFGPQLFIILAIGLTFWLFFIRPQAKRAKTQKKFIEDLQKGDKIVTVAGIHAAVNKVNDDGTLQIEVSPGSYIKIEKSAISMEWTANVNKPAPAEKK